MRTNAAIAVVAGLLAATLVLLAIEIASGAGDYGTLRSKNPCTAAVDYPGEGLDATLQRIALSGLYGAACELRTTREELVLSFVPSVSRAPIEWDRETIERAVEAGLLRAIDDARDRGALPAFAAAILREIVRRAPIDWLLDRAGILRDLARGTDGLRDRLDDVLGDVPNPGEAFRPSSVG